jgi:hypothetical protein
MASGTRRYTPDAVTKRHRNTSSADSDCESSFEMTTWQMTFCTP